jgi:hypothetical protein
VIFSIVLYSLFSLLATVGIFWIVRYNYTTRRAILWSVVTLVSFAALAVWVIWVLHTAAAGAG